MSRRRSRRRRRGVETDDALELFLDAMSNLFGGVVFVAVAVVVLLRMTVPAAAPTADNDSADAPTADAVRAETADLRTLLAALGPAPADAPTTPAPPTDPPPPPLDALRAEIDRARDARRITTERLSQTQAKLLDAQKKLEDARARPPHRLRIPRFRASSRQEYPVLLRGGRLVPVFLADGLGPTPRRNTDQLVIDAGALTVAPRPGAGTPLRTAAPGDAHAALTRFFAPLDPARHFVALAVWPDSFPAAEAARDFLTQRGFEYGLSFIADGQAVPFRATGGVQ